MRRHIAWGVLLASALLGFGRLSAQEEKLREGHSVHGEAFNEGPRQAGYLMLGQGTIDFPVCTTSGEAQAFMSQGVGQLHGFFYLEAERSFRQAATLDPACPMFYWGMAMANANNADRAKGFLKKAQEKAEQSSISHRERLYLDALAAKYAEGKDDKARRNGWLQGLETITQEFPDDLDARAWLVMVTWENGRRDGIGSREIVSQALDSILERHPLHPGAHHYKIHLWDGFKQERAVVSAGLYAKAQPGIAHAWHMPGHTYTGLKRYSDAAYQQEGSARVDHAYMKRDHVMPFQIHNYAHNNQWLAESLTRIGQPHKAIEVARNLVEQPRDPKLNNKSNGGSAQRSGRQRWMEALISFELWDELIAAVQSGALDFSDVPYERLQREYALGLAYASKGDKAGLEAQIAALQGLKNVKAEPEDAGLESNRKDAPADEKPADEDTKEETKEKEESGSESPDSKADEKAPKAKKPPRIPGLEPALAELEGYKLLLDGQPDAAFERWKKASNMRREAMARAYLQAGRLDDAVARAKEAVDRGANEVATMAHHVEMLAAAGKTDEARTQYVQFLEIARDAEPATPVMSRLSRVLTTWREQDGWEPAPLASRTDDAFRNRLDLEKVGPLNWSPTAAEPFEVVDHTGKSHTLEGYRGKNLVLIFYLGGECAHCMQQLIIFSEKIESLKAQGVEVLAVGTDTEEGIRTLSSNPDVKIRMPLVADPGLALFRRYRAFDDFENQPMHGTFLIDARGEVRYQNIAHEPFFEVEFIQQEAQRVDRLLGRGSNPATVLTPGSAAAETPAAAGGL